MRTEIESGSELGQELNKFVGDGKLAPDKQTIELVRRGLATVRSEAGFILDGFPRNLFQAQAMEPLLKELGLDLDRVVELAVSRDVARERLIARMRPGETRETIEKRLDNYEETTVPVLQFFAKRGTLLLVDGEGDPESVFKRALGVLGL